MKKKVIRNVYVVLVSHDYEGDSLDGAYATLEGAQNHKFQNWGDRRHIVRVNLQTQKQTAFEIRPAKRKKKGKVKR